MAKSKHLTREERSIIADCLNHNHSFKFIANEISKDCTTIAKEGKRQSIHHICVHHQDSIMVSKSTIYRLVDYNLLTARNIDLPRKVRYAPRKKKTTFKIDKACRNGRTYEDYLTFRHKYPDLPVTRIDSVEGTKGGKAPVNVTMSLFACVYQKASL